MDCYQTDTYSHFYVVVSSKQEDFNACRDYDEFENAFGVDDPENWIYLGNEHDVVNMETDKVYTLRITANWKDKQCKLIFYYQGKKLNETNHEYTILLPDLDDQYVWYPCVTPHNKDAYCIIHYA